MADEIKFTDDELKSIEELRSEYVNIINRFGQIALTKYNLQIFNLQSDFHP